MTRESDEYTVDEAARLLGMSPARVRQLLRSGELEGVRREERIEGVLGPWRIPAVAVRGFGERLDAKAAETTVALSPGETLAGPLPGGQGASPHERTADTPSETSELLSESVRALREKAEGLLKELQSLEGRLEATEIQEIALREELRREKELRAELEAQRSGRREEPWGPWRRLFGR